MFILIHTNFEVVSCTTKPHRQSMDCIKIYIEGMRWSYFRKHYCKENTAWLNSYADIMFPLYVLSIVA